MVNDDLETPDYVQVGAPWAARSLVVDRRMVHLVYSV